MMSTEELTLEVRRLRVLDRQHRQISEQAEADIRRIRLSMQAVERDIAEVTDRLRDALRTGASRMDMEEILTSYESLQNRLKHL